MGWGLVWAGGWSGGGGESGVRIELLIIFCC